MHIKVSSTRLRAINFQTMCMTIDVLAYHCMIYHNIRFNFRGVKVCGLPVFAIFVFLFLRFVT